MIAHGMLYAKLHRLAVERFKQISFLSIVYCVPLRFISPAFGGCIQACHRHMACAKEKLKSKHIITMCYITSETASTMRFKPNVQETEL